MIIQEEDRPKTRGIRLNKCKYCSQCFYTIADEWDEKCLECHFNKQLKICDRCGHELAPFEQGQFMIIKWACVDVECELYLKTMRVKERK